MYKHDLGHDYLYPEEYGVSLAFKKLQQCISINKSLETGVCI